MWGAFTRLMIIRPYFSLGWLVVGASAEELRIWGTQAFGILRDSKLIWVRVGRDPTIRAGTKVRCAKVTLRTQSASPSPHLPLHVTWLSLILKTP